ncbi:MAG: type II CAAX endopeptidase family protein [Cyanobacteria bacterium]|nr:type II CAAX endopeptidase family protein [Cyanobacteriota bacterium]
MTPEATAPLFPTPLRRLMLIIMTLLVSVIMGQALIGSWNQPQVASRLELYQTDLLLQATEWEGNGFPPEQVELLRQNLLGEAPLTKAQDAYTEVRATATKILAGADGNAPVTQDRRLQSAYKEQAELLDVLDLRLGILQAEQGDTAAAIAAWQTLQSRRSNGSPLWQTAQVLTDLWQGGKVEPDSDRLLTDTLNGWFRNRALTQFYIQTDQGAVLDQLYLAEQQRAETTLVTLALVGAVPVIGCVLGIALLVGLLWQRLQQGAKSLLARHGNQPWETPWAGETIWQVLVVGFLFSGQIMVPLLISPLGGVLNSFGSRGRAFYALLYYVFMAVLAIAVLAISIRPYRPLPKGWFEFKLSGSAWLWGVGGYLVALPLMLAVSLANQQLWQGQGGSNPLLQTVLEAQDPITLGVFFFTAAIAAPLFEEFLFRGFLLPSLTRYMPVGGAIALSSLIFAAAHLSLSEVLPLMVLGMVMGVVYTRSRNLVAPMVLHSAWNGITMLGLFLLGSSAN